MTDSKPLDEPSDDSSSGPGGSARRIVLYSLVGVVVLALIVGGSLAVYRHASSQASAACETQSSRLVKSQEDAAKLQKSDGFRATLAIDKNQVQEQGTVTDLQSQYKEYSTRPAEIPSCSHLGIKETKALTEELRDRANNLSSRTVRVRAAADAVVASREAKVLADAKGSLSSAVKAAQGTLDSSQGKVADNASREALQKALDAANKVLADEGVKDPKRYRDVQASLAAPVKSVNDSVAAKAAADKAAADAAAQAAARAQAQSSSGSSGTKSYSRSSGSGSSGSTGSGASSGSSAKRQTGSSASSGSGKKSNSGGSSSGSSSSGSQSGGGSSWRDQFNNNTQAPCAAGASCPIG
jgi:hypothetical protein